VVWTCLVFVGQAAFHIANPHIQAALREEVASFGERLPVLCTPEELLRDEDH
jgi:hypothetical protein